MGIIQASDIPDAVLQRPFKLAANRFGLRDMPLYKGVEYERRIANRFLGIDAKVANEAFKRLQSSPAYDKLAYLRDDELEGVVLDAGTLGELYLFFFGFYTARGLRNELDFNTAAEAKMTFQDVIATNFLRARSYQAVPEREMILQRFDEFTNCMHEGIKLHFEQPYDIRVISN